MADGTATLNQMVATLRGLPESVRGSLPKCGAFLKQAMEANIAAQRSPTGEPWPDTADGRQALKSAGKQITFTIHGTTLVFTLGGVEARHHFGWVRGGKQRQILPGDMQDKAVIDSMWKGLQDTFRNMRRGIP